MKKTIPIPTYSTMNNSGYTIQLTILKGDTLLILLNSTDKKPKKKLKNGKIKANIAPTYSLNEDIAYIINGIAYRPKRLIQIICLYAEAPF